MKKGDKLYQKDSEIIEHTITSMGRKYFTTDKSRNKFHVDSLRMVTQYMGFNLYADKNALMEEIESEKIVSRIRPVFQGWAKPKLTIEQLRQIDAILTPATSDNN